jgi:hypothetical protein
MESIRIKTTDKPYQPPAGEVAAYVGDLAGELEGLASSAGLTSLAAYLRAAAWEARSLTDGDPSQFRRP